MYKLLLQRIDELGLTPSQLVEMTGLPKSTLYRAINLEYGGVSMTLVTFEKLCATVGLELTARVEQPVL